MKEFKQNRRTILIASVLLQFCYGLAYVWSVFQPYVKERYDMDTGSANMPFAVFLACFSFGNVLAGLLQKKISSVYLVVIGNLGLLLGITGSAFIPIDQGYLLNLSYGILGGCGAGVAYNTTVTTVQQWFPEKRGLVTGMLICSTGSFGLIMNPIAQSYLSMYGYQIGMLVVAGIMAVCLIIGSGFMDQPRASVKDKVQIQQVSTEGNLSLGEVLKTPQYYMITLSMMLAVPGYFLINPMLMSLGSARGLTSQVALIGVMIVAVMNTSGRLLAPWLSDFLGRRKMLIGLFTMNMMAILLVSFLRDLKFVVAIGAVGFTYGGFMGMYPTITADYFGAKNNGLNYGMVMVGYGLSSLACPYLVKAVQSSAMGTMLSLVIAAVASTIGIVLMILLKQPQEQPKTHRVCMTD